MRKPLAGYRAPDIQSKSLSEIEAERCGTGMDVEATA
jgi:hypothetical protein